MKSAMIYSSILQGTADHWHVTGRFHYLHGQQSGESGRKDKYPCVQEIWEIYDDRDVSRVGRLHTSRDTQTIPQPLATAVRHCTPRCVTGMHQSSSRPSTFPHLTRIEALNTWAASTEATDYEKRLWKGCLYWGYYGSNVNTSLGLGKMNKKFKV